MPVDYELLRDAALFSELEEDVLRALAEHCEYRELPAGMTLFEQGAPGDALYLLQTGQVHIVRQHPDGEQVILATEGPYYVIGDLSMIADQPRTGAVMAVSDCGLIKLDRDSFCRACDHYPGLALKVMTYLGRRLYRMNLQVREYAIGNVAARVASVIVLLSGGANGAVISPLHVIRVARAAATDADVVERLLASWSDEGYLTFDGRQVTIHDIETLRAIAG